MHIIIRLLNYLKPYRRKFAGVLFFIIISSLLSLSIPYLIKNFIDISWQNKNIFNMKLIIWIVGIIFCLQKIFSSLQGYWLTFIGEKIILILQNQLYFHIQNSSLKFFEKYKTGDLMARITKDVGSIQGLITSDFTNLITSVLTLIGGIILIFYLNWKLALIPFIGLPLVALINYKIGGKLKNLNRYIRDKIGYLTSILEESISGIKVIQSFQKEEWEIKRFEKENENIFINIMKIIKLKNTFYPLINLSIEIGMLVVIWLGGMAVIQGEITPGSLICFLGYLYIVTGPLNNLSRIYISVQESLSAGERIFEILDTKSEIQDLQDAMKISGIKGYIKFKNVTFNYDNRDLVLNQVNFGGMPGEIVALVGPSAEGKTTIANLIPRFYDPQDGEILIDGINIRKVKLESLRKQIGIVHQDVFLFNTSIKENIAYGKLDASFDEIVESAKIANAHQFILQLPDGYDTIVGERGVRLSGGQKQRIAIARAIIGKPRILILDEATSSLDAEAEAEVQDALYKFVRENNITTIIIAHRLSTIMFADRILVVKEGKVVEEGTHKELIENAEIYQRLYKRQVEMFA